MVPQSLDMKRQGTTKNDFVYIYIIFYNWVSDWTPPGSLSAPVLLKILEENRQTCHAVFCIQPPGHRLVQDLRSLENSDLTKARLLRLEIAWNLRSAWLRPCGRRRTQRAPNTMWTAPINIDTVMQAFSSTWRDHPAHDGVCQVLAAGLSWHKEALTWLGCWQICCFTNGPWTFGYGTPKCPKHSFTNKTTPTTHHMDTSVPSSAIQPVLLQWWASRVPANWALWKNPS